MPRRLMMRENPAIQLVTRFRLLGLYVLVVSCATSSTTQPSQEKIVSSSLSAKTKTRKEESPLPAVLKKANTAEDCFTLGIGFEQRRRYDHAIQAYRRSLNFDDEFHRARINLGLALVRTNKYAEAKAHCQRVIDDVSDTAMAWYCLGLSNYKLQDFSSATKQLTRSLELRSPAPVVRLQLAKSYLDSGKLAPGLEALTITSSTGRNRPNILLHVAKAYEDLGRQREAETTYLLILKRTPKNYLATIKLARLYARTSRPARAGPYFQKAINLKPQNASALVAYLDWRLKSQLSLTPVLKELEKNFTIQQKYKAKIAYYFWVSGQEDRAMALIRSGLSHATTSGQQIALEKLRQRILAKENPTLSIPFFSTKPVKPKKRLPKSQIPEE